MAARASKAYRRPRARAGPVSGAFGVSHDGTRQRLEFARIELDIGGHQLEVEFRDQRRKPRDALRLHACDSLLIFGAGSANMVYVSIAPFRQRRKRPR